MLDRMKSRTPGGVTRRGVLVGFAAAATVGLAREIAFEEGYDAVKEAARPAGHSFLNVTLGPKRMVVLASPGQKAALDAWRQGRREIPEWASDRASDTYRGGDGRQWIRQQGRGIGLWEGFSGRVVDIPMAEQPDPAYGAWCEARMLTCAMKAEARFEKVRGFVVRERKPMLTEYTALLLPYGDDVKSVTARV